MKALLQRVSTLKNNEFVRVSSWSAFATFFRMVASFISIKIVAHLIGPSGIAILGQFTNTITIISTLGTGCITQGVTKYIAEHKEDTEKVQRLIGNSLIITVGSSLFITLLVLVFHQQIGFYIFKTTSYNSVILCFAATIIFFALNLLMISIVNGFKSFKKVVSINIATSFASLLLTVPIVYFFGVTGALISIILSQTVVVFFTLYFVRGEAWFHLLKKWHKLDKKIIRMLFGFTVMTFVSALVGPYVQLFIRSHIIERLSIADAGVWEGMNRLSGLYLSVITTSISIYYLPRLSEIREANVLRLEIFKTAKIVLPPLAAFCFLLFLCRDLVVYLAFSAEFLRMRELFAVQLIGDFFKIASWLMAYVFWAKAMTRTFIITEIVFSITLSLFSYLFIDAFGFRGTVYGYTLNYLIYFLTVVLILRRLIFYGKW